VVFALDRSAAMGGAKLAAARRAVARMVETLGPRDRFAVLAFDHEAAAPPRLRAGLVPADGPHRAHAAAFLGRLAGRGGAADLAAALGAAAGLLARTDPLRERVLVLVTAGRSADADPALRVWATRGRGVKVFALGVEAAAAAGLLRRLADLGGGAVEMAESADRLEGAADRLHRRLVAPRLAGLTLRAAGFDIVPDTVVPARPPDVFPGEVVCVCGRYKGPPDGELAAAATDPADRAWAAAVPARVTVNPAVTAAWARGYVRQLEDRYAARPADRADLERRIVATSLRFGVLSRFTALVAVERAATAMSRRPPDPAADALPFPGTSRVPGGSHHAIGDEPLHGYLLVDFLGKGTFGELWKARDRATGKLVGLKMIDLTGSPAAWKELRALEVLKNLNHPNLVPVFTARLRDRAGRELGLLEDLEPHRQRGDLKELVIAMGLGEKSLAARLKEVNPEGTPAEDRRGLPVPELVRYLRGAARGIDFLNQPDHGLGQADGRIIHCDVKPETMMVVAGEVQIAEAGFTRILSPDARQSRVAGTPAYSPPELIDGTPGPGTDQYALAVSYYELRTGRLPFPDGASVQQIILAHALGDLDFSSPQLTPGERAVLQRATAKAPGDRYESCDELVEELTAVPDVRSQLKARRTPIVSAFLPSVGSGEVIDIFSPEEAADDPAPPPSREEGTIPDLHADVMRLARPVTPADFGDATPPEVEVPAPAVQEPEEPAGPVLAADIAAILRGESPTLVPPDAPAPEPPPPPPPMVPGGTPSRPDIPLGRRGLAVPVDPNDPLGARFATAVPDEEIQKIISDSQQVAHPPKRAVPPPPDPAPPADPSDPGAGRRTAPLSEDEMRRVAAESQLIAARTVKEEEPPPPRPKAVPPKVVPPKAARPKSDPAPPPTPPPADDSPSKPEWYKEAVQAQQHESRRQARATGGGRPVERRRPPRERPEGSGVWVLVFLGLVLAVAGAMALVVLLR
jgi:serine/threonine protein kinase